MPSVIPSLFRPNKRVLAAALILLSPSFALGLGIRIPSQDAKAAARGNAFTATADNPSAIFYNPAGITQLEGQNFSLGTYLVSIDSRFTSPTGQVADTIDRVAVVPHAYYTLTPKNRPFSFGLGIYAPYGLSLDWGQNTPFWSLTTKARLTYVCINPVIAWKIHETFSIAAGLTVNYSNTDIRRGIFVPGDQLRLTGDGWDAGFTLGLLWKPIRQLAFGASYRSATTIDYHGEFETKPYAPAEAQNARVNFPQQVVLGVSWRPTPAWNFEVDFDWTDWDRINNVTVNKASGPLVLPFQWKSSRMIKVGGSRYFKSGFAVHAGYFFSENSVPDASFSPIVPDQDLHVFSVGVGYKSSRRFTCDLTYQFIYGPSRDVSGSVSTSLIGQSANGAYEWTSHAILLTAGYSF